MKVVYKYQLKLTNEQTIFIPTNFEIMRLGVQNEHICLWALVDDTEIIEEFTFHIYGTGHHIYGTGHHIPDADRLRHIGSVLMTQGALVWHVFITKNSLLKSSVTDKW